MTMPNAPEPAGFAEFNARLAADMAQTGWHFHKAADGPFDRFQVLGERGCGTNIIRKTVQDALVIRRTEALGWKHGVPSMIAIPPSFLVICALRGPRAWTTSLYRRPWHAAPHIQALDFSTFIRTPWHARVDREDHFEGTPPHLHPMGEELQWDRHPITGARYDTVFAMRNLKHRALLSMPERGASVVYVSLDAFNADPQAFLRDLADTFGLAHSEEGYNPVKRRMGNRWTPEIPDRPPAPRPWPPADIAWMNSQLDPQIETALGFPPQPD
ncbi:hypothetical protein [uncultured Sulfitobacter sp.]|uniref:hypothetical protein n=1 Tax=uncultured Sulfitobacter sp. TaxID=191468 RepID=UPI002602FE61|nr:hypothetical protein [uncultured Sulfitobacter sp.]